MEQMYHAFIHQILPGYVGPKKGHEDNVGGSQVPFRGKQIGGRKNLPILEEEFLFPPSKLLNRDQSFNDSQLGLSVQFLYYQFPNSSMSSALKRWKVRKLNTSSFHLSRENEKNFLKTQVASEIPRVLVIGTGSWSIRSSDPLDPLSLEEYSAGLSTLVMVHLFKSSCSQSSFVIYINFQDYIIRFHL